MTPGEQLKAWRAERALSQSAAAKLARVNRSSWNATELGLHVRDDYALRILSFTGIDVRQANKRNAPRAVRPSKSVQGAALQQWRIRECLTKDQAADRCGVGRSVWAVAERGAYRISADLAERIRLTTGILPESDLPTKKTARKGAHDEDDESDLRGKLCWHCCDMPHRRPQSKPCRCGQTWAPDIVQHPVPGLRSSASWCGDFADAGDE